MAWFLVLVGLLLSLAGCDPAHMQGVASGALYHAVDQQGSYTYTYCDSKVKKDGVRTICGSY